MGFSSDRPRDDDVETVDAFGGGHLYFAGNDEKLLLEEDKPSKKNQKKPSVKAVKETPEARTLVVRYNGATMKLSLKASWFHRPIKDVLKKVVAWAEKKGPVANVRFKNVRADATVGSVPGELDVETVDMRKIRAAISLKNWDAVLVDVLHTDDQLQECLLRAYVAKQRWTDALAVIPSSGNLNPPGLSAAKKALLARGHLSHPLLKDDDVACLLRDAAVNSAPKKTVSLCDRVLQNTFKPPFAYELRADAKRKLALQDEPEETLRTSRLAAAHTDADIAVALGSPLGLLVRARILRLQHRVDLALKDYAAFLQDYRVDDVISSSYRDEARLAIRSLTSDHKKSEG